MACKVKGFFSPFENTDWKEYQYLSDGDTTTTKTHMFSKSLLLLLTDTNIIITIYYSSCLMQAHAFTAMTDYY